MRRGASTLVADLPSVSIARQGADLVLTTRLGLAAAPQVRDLVVRDPRQPHAYRARPLHLARLQSLIGAKYPVLLAFDPTPPLDLTPHIDSVARPYQDEALAAWDASGRCGVVVLPTGAGKTLVAALAIARAHTRALMLVPTIDLCRQTRQALVDALGLPDEAVGIVCAGDKEWDRPIVVSTYDSAAAALGRVGDFGLLVADEVHHLPAPGYRAIAEAATAPYRLGVSATLTRSDGREADLDELIGPVVYTEKSETLLADGYLAPYRVITLRVDLSPKEYSGPRKRNTKGGTFKVGDDKKWDNNIQPPTKPVSCKSCSGRTKPWGRLPQRAGCIRINGGAGKRSPSRACRACSTGAMRRSILKPRTSSRSRISMRKSDA